MRDIDATMHRREAALVRTKDQVARLRQKLDELEAEGRFSDDPEYRDAQDLHFWTCVLAHYSPAPALLKPEEC